MAAATKVTVFEVARDGRERNKAMSIIYDDGVGTWAEGPAHPTRVDKMTRLVSAGDIAGMRAHFDELFWSGRAERPEWTHLKIALLREDRPMLRLLKIWGAAPKAEDLVRLRAETDEKYPRYAALLCATGFGASPAGEAPEADPQPPRHEIAMRAYEIYCENGHAGGRDTENWLRAEIELKAKMFREEARRIAEEKAELFKELHQTEAHKRKAATLYPDRKPSPPYWPP
jgi:hypothetical protein